MLPFYYLEIHLNPLFLLILIALSLFFAAIRNQMYDLSFTIYYELSYYEQLKTGQIHFYSSLMINKPMSV